MAELAPHDLTSNWSHLSYYAAASSQFSGSFAPYKAFDGTTNYWIGTGSGVDWLRIDLGIGASATVSSYQITVNSIPEPNRAPKDWTFQGSNDASSWTTIDTQTSQTAWTSGETRTYTISGSPAAYRYYRVNITSNNGDATYTQIQELHVIGTVVTAQKADFAPHNMTSNTAPSPYVAAASSTFSTDSPWKAFNGVVSDATNGWLGTGSGVDWLSLDLGTGVSKILYGYAVATTDETTRAVKAWTLQGSNDNSSWTTLDTESSQTGWASDESRTYTCASPTTGYRYFRINITQNNGDATYTNVAELYFYGIDAPTDITLSPGAGSIAVTPGTPTVALSGTISLSPGAGSIALTPGTPVLTTPLVLHPGAGAIALTGGTPVVAYAIFVAPAAAQIQLTTAAPGVSLVRTVGSGDQLYIGDTVFQWHESTFKIIKTLSGEWAAEFDIDYYGGTRPVVNDEVAFFWQSVKRFGGLVQSAEEVYEPGNEEQPRRYSKLKVKCGGFQLLTDRAIIAKLFTVPIGGLSGIVVYEIWREKLAQFGVSKIGDAPSTFIGEQLFHYITVTEAFNKIKSQDPGYDWWIDDDKLLHYESTNPSGGATAPFTLRNGDGNVERMTVKTSSVRFRNKQWVLPSADIAALKDEAYIATAGQTVFPTTYVLNSKPIITVNGVKQIVTSLGDWVTGWQAYYIPGGIGVFFAAAPGAGAAVDVFYPNPFPVAFSAQDDASILAVGLYESVWQAKNVFTQATAEAEAQGLLDLYSTGGYPVEIELVYNSVRQSSWLAPAMVVDVDYIYPTASGLFTVEEVTSREVELTFWEHTVKMRSGLGEITDAQALEQYRVSARVPINSPPYRWTAELFTDLPGITNPGANTGPISNTFVVRWNGIVALWDIVFPIDPPTGADFQMDILLNGTSILPAGAANKVVVPDGSIDLQTGIDFLQPNIPVVPGDQLTLVVLQVGSDNPGTNATFHLDIKVTGNAAQTS